ncbi:MAG: sigma-70 family RNA polymerase sigma factor [Chitinophagaceae bacterium]|nr:sigma-70 family RNA polymerase sigma factor [Chitinophagaceae bacterium]
MVFNYYSKHVYTIALQFTKDDELAYDLTQEIFTRLWVYRGKLSDVHHFKGYLNTVSKNLIRNFLNQRVFTTSNIEYLEAFFAETAGSPQDFLEQKELQGILDEAVNHLPAQQKKAFLLSRSKGLSHEEIARLMNISVITSQSYIVRALKFLRIYLAERRHLILFHLLIFATAAFFFHLS